MLKLTFSDSLGQDQGIDLPDPQGKSFKNTAVELANRVRRVNQRHKLNVNSAWRNPDDQLLFFNCAQTKKSTGRCPPGCERSACASANRPGESNHEFGLAVDIEPLDGNWSRFKMICREEGLHDPISNEAWHWQPNEVSKGYYTGTPAGFEEKV